MPRRQNMPADRMTTGPDRRLTPAWTNYLASLEGASGMDRAAPVADMAGTETLAQTQTKINDILAALRAAGIMEP